MLGIAIGAALLGLIIGIMEQGEFPGWVSMIICVLAALIPAAIINAMLPPSLSIVGLAVGAVCAGCAISAFCGMSVKRASTAAAIWLGVQFVIGLAFQLMLAA